MRPPGILGLLLTCSVVSLTAQEAVGRFRFNGFGTLGGAISSTDLAEFVRDPNQPVGVSRQLDPNLDSRLGGQVLFDWTKDLSLTGQMISKYRYDHTYTPVVSWAFLNYAPVSGLQVRLGRVGWDVFPLADTRDVGYAYLWVRPPVDFFGLLQFSSMDGGDIAWTTPVGPGWSLKLKMGFGQDTANDQIQVTQGKVLNLAGTKLLGSMAELHAGALDLRLSYAQATPARDYPPPISDLSLGLAGFATLLNDPGLTQQAARLSFKANHFKYYSLGLGWHEGALQVESALAMIHTGSGPIPNVTSGFLSCGYRWGAVVPYAQVSRIHSEPNTPYLGAVPALGPQGALLGAGITSFLQAMRANQSTASLGARWDCCPKAAVKLQVDRVLGDPNALMLWRGPQPGWDGIATVASATLDFVF